MLKRDNKKELQDKLHKSNTLSLGKRSFQKPRRGMTGQSDTMASPLGENIVSQRVGQDRTAETRVGMSFPQIGTKRHFPKKILFLKIRTGQDRTGQDSTAQHEMLFTTRVNDA